MCVVRAPPAGVEGAVEGCGRVSCAGPCLFRARGRERVARAQQGYSRAGVDLCLAETAGAARY